MSVECQVNVKSQSELDIGGRETCLALFRCEKPFMKAIQLFFSCKLIIKVGSGSGEGQMRV